MIPFHALEPKSLLENISVIRKVMPQVIAHELASVQPMSKASANIYTLRYVKQKDMPEPNQGERQHDFIHGWQRYYGTQWIAEHLWIKIKLRGL